MSRHNVALKPRSEISREGSRGSTFHLQVRGDSDGDSDKKRISMIDLSQRRPCLFPIRDDVALGAAKRHITRVKYREACDLTAVED